MSLNINDAPKGAGGVDNGIAKAGTQMARLIGVVNTGEHAREFKGEAKKPCVQIAFTFELPTDRIALEEGGEDYPRFLTKGRVNFLQGETATLTEIVSALDPNNECGGDLAKLLGRPCFVTIEHKKYKDRDIAKIKNITGVPDGINVPALENPSFFFDVYEPNFESYSKLLPWMREALREAIDFEGSEMARVKADWDAVIEQEKENDKPDRGADKDEGGAKVGVDAPASSASITDSPY